MHRTARSIATALLALTTGLALVGCSSSSEPAAESAPASAKPTTASGVDASLSTLTIDTAKAKFAESSLGCTAAEVDTTEPFGTAFTFATTVKCDRGDQGKNVYAFVWDSPDNMVTETKIDCTLINDPAYSDAAYVIGANWNAVTGALDELEAIATALGGKVTSPKRECGIE